MITDSRAYRFIYALRQHADVPNEFLSAIPEIFETGVFIPQDDKRWYTEQPRFPACLLLLSQSVLHVLIHPSTGLSPFSADLSRLHEIEHGTNLLHGWIRFTTLDRKCEVEYNTRASEPLEEFLRVLARSWPDGCATVVEEPLWMGERPNLKFANLLKTAVETPAESIRFGFFYSPTAVHTRGMRLRKKIQQWPGHLLLVTTAGRLLWLRDEYDGIYSPYAAVKTWTRTAHVVQCSAEPNGRELVINFKSGSSWRLRVPNNDPALGNVASLLNRLSDEARHAGAPKLECAH